MQNNKNNLFQFYKVCMPWCTDLLLVHYSLCDTNLQFKTLKRCNKKILFFAWACVSGLHIRMHIHVSQWNKKYSGSAALLGLEIIIQTYLTGSTDQSESDFPESGVIFRDWCIITFELNVSNAFSCTPKGSSGFLRLPDLPGAD